MIHETVLNELEKAAERNVLPSLAGRKKDILKLIKSPSFLSPLAL